MDGHLAPFQFKSKKGSGIGIGIGYHSFLVLAYADGPSMHSTPIHSNSLHINSHYVLQQTLLAFVVEWALVVIPFNLFLKMEVQIVMGVSYIIP